MTMMLNVILLFYLLCLLGMSVSGVLKAYTDMFV
ncbi:hypothetical protein Gotri_005909 [Gossypium trilobum]|uniref:Uncharacterized protein n=1 Tax=Gossypium trilobum TaxID=34281 RepID=A0A7J9EZ43_9ROSI|nr:hypothetical protein [Gossypium trilobum]